MGNQKSKFDAVLLGLAFGLFSFGIAGQYLFPTQPLLLRLIGLLFVAGVAVWLVSRTVFGRRMYAYWNDSVIELRKVVWPTKQETIHSTIAVLAMVFIMGLVLWSIDAILVRLMAWIVRQGVV